VGPRGGNCANINIKNFAFFSLPSQQHAEGKFIAEKLGCRFVETSAKLGSNVTETFIDLVCEIRDRNREMLEMRRVLRPVTPDSGIQLPGAGCWNKGCTVS